jgi:FkbM family methyltransferase
MRDPYWHPGFRLSAAPVLVDIGAHIGGWTIYMSRRFPDARVVAFEPVGATFALLEENIRRNQLTGVTAFNVALAPRAGSLKLWFDSERSAYSAANPRLMHRHGAYLPVRALTLSDCLQRAGVTHIDVLKCDIEGAEFSLLPSLAPKLLKTVANVALEYHLFDRNHRLATLIDFFDRHGFELLERTPTLVDSGYAKFRRRTTS